MPLQGKFVFAHDGKKITAIDWTKRPGWSAEVKREMPSIKGMDRGHVDPWLGIKKQLTAVFLGATKKQAAAQINHQGGSIDLDADWDAIEDAINDLARSKSNDLDHLEYEDSSANRSSGAKLPRAAEIAEEVYEIDGATPNYPYEVTDTSGKSIILEDKKAAEKWLLSVGIPTTGDAAERKKIIASYKKARTPSGGIACTIL